MFYQLYRYMTHQSNLARATDLRSVRLGLLGCGTVGSALVGLIDNVKEAVAAEHGLALVVSKVAVQDPKKHKNLPKECISIDPVSVATSPDVDIVVELMGGISPAKESVEAALRSSKPVVSANKALISRHLPALAELSKSCDSSLFFDAAVAGAVPVISTLRASSAVLGVNSFLGVVNGTTNFILSMMRSSGCSFDEALSMAKSLGFAEQDPSADVLGHDAAAKAALLAALGFRVDVSPSAVYTTPLDRVVPADHLTASRLDRVVKPVVVGSFDGSSVSLASFPALVPSNHKLASASFAENILILKTTHAADLVFAGPGAGGSPTATAVLADILRVAASEGSTRRTAPLGPFTPTPIAEPAPLRTMLPVWFYDAQSGLSEVLGLLDRLGLTVESFTEEPASSLPTDPLAPGPSITPAPLPRYVFTLAPAPITVLLGLLDRLASCKEVLALGQLYRFLD